VAALTNEGRGVIRLRSDEKGAARAEANSGRLGTRALRKAKDTD